MLVKLAWSSLMHRKGSVLLAILSVSVSLFVLFGVEQIRSHAKDSFNRTVSGVDLIVGARTGPINLLLYSVFRMGSPSANISWQTYQRVADEPAVSWSIPISLGDSHKGYRVVGTSQDFFEHFRFGKRRPLEFAQGAAFADTLDVVLGAEVARKLGYGLGDSVVLAHGLGSTSFHNHDDRPFKVTGILQPTGTPTDQALYISLQGMEAVHDRHWDGSELEPQTITAFMLGLNSPVKTFQLQRQINTARGEPLLAILPGVALSQLWQMLRVVENILLLVSALVVLASLLGLCIMLLTSIRERRREIALLRTIGAGPLQLFLLIQMEALLVLVLGACAALSVLSIGLRIAEPLLAAHYGIYLEGSVFTEQSMLLFGIIAAATFVVTLIPAIGVYRESLKRGLEV